MAGTAAAFAVLTMSLIVVLAPQFRWFGTKLALLLAIAVVVCNQAGDSIPAISLALGVVALAVILPSQPWFLDRLQSRGIAKSRVERRVSLGTERLWAALLPQGTNTYWDPHVRGVRPGEEPDIFFFVYEALSVTGEVQIPVRVFDIEDCAHFKTQDLSQPDARDGGPVVVASYVIEPDGERALLTLMEATWRPRLWTLISQWLDDYLADHVDRMTALLEGRRDWSVKGATLRSLGLGG